MGHGSTGINGSGLGTSQRSQRTPPCILTVITHLAVGGAERIARSIVGGTPEFRHVVFVCRGHDGNSVGDKLCGELEAAGARIVFGSYLELKHGGIVAAAWRLRACIGMVKPDLVHVHTEIPEATLTLARLSGSGSHLPVVRTIHNSQLWTHWKWIGRVVERVLHGAHVTAVSTAALRAYEGNRTTLGDPGRSPKLVPNGVPCACRAMKVRPSTPAVILFAGRLEPQKGADRLPGIVSALRRRVEGPLQVRVFGSGTLRHRLDSWALTNSSPDLTIEVRDPTSKLGQELADADVFIMPSLFEGLSLVAFEALCEGTPVVAHDVPGLREAFPHAYPGLVPVDADAFADGVAGALTRREAWKAWMTEAQARIRQYFAEDVMVGGYAETYRAILAPPSRADPTRAVAK